MGRRSLISATDINRIMSAYRSRKKEKERIALINAQNDNEKELPPVYTIEDFKFDSNTRAATIIIIREQQYRTIERYVTQNYVRYPIYSELKTKYKTFTKNIKLTNAVLENLRSNKDELICMFAKEIVYRMNDTDLLPSWFILDMLFSQYEEKLTQIDESNSSTFDRIHSEIASYKDKIASNDNYIFKNSGIIQQQKIKVAKVDKKINALACAKKSLLKSIFTLFIYNLITSRFRLNKLKNKSQSIHSSIKKLSEDLNEKKSENTAFSEKISELNLEEQNLCKKIDSEKQAEYKVYMSNAKKNRRLTDTDNLIDNFIPLNTLNGLEYKKIVGCYIIRNTLNGKCYVGQSKDVLRRLKQHFKGSVPNNIIFAEDYYNADTDKRDNLFEFKVIECQTKDELDKTEKSLIEEYDSYKTGYNGTSGNL